ncbi:hypothetical protein Leryth_014121 [Lithospermum erythrorhizon]|nr:hypothetical protein Leryth_014121 [Lithospermum erythrorhizon]
MANSKVPIRFEADESCAKAVLERRAFMEIAFALWLVKRIQCGDLLFSTVFKKDTKFYQRRGRNGRFSLKRRFVPPSSLRVVSCASLEVLQSYLTWRQKDCHDKNLYPTCFGELIHREKSDREKANGILKQNRKKQQKRDLLFKEFEINYKELPDIVRQGSFVLKQEVEEIITKDGSDGTPVKRMRRKVTTVHSKNVTSRSFWSTHPYLLKELGEFEGDICKLAEFMKFEYKIHCHQPWISIRIKRLSLPQVSDEPGFVLKKDSQFYGRRPSEIVSVIISFFTSVYVMKWKECFLLTELKLSPYFDGRAICYPSNKILLDYLTWRQVDCHINNQYNTCFWMLVKSDKTKMTKAEAQEYLKGTQTREKNKLLNDIFDMDYSKLPIMFRQGSSVF